METAAHQDASPQGRQAVVAWLQSYRDDVVQRFSQAERAITPIPLRRAGQDRACGPAESLLQASEPFLLKDDASDLEAVLRDLVRAAMAQGVPTERILALTSSFRSSVLELFEGDELAHDLGELGRSQLAGFFDQLRIAEAGALAERLDDAQATLHRHTDRNECLTRLAGACAAETLQEGLPGIAQALARLVPFDRIELLLAGGAEGCLHSLHNPNTQGSAEVRSSPLPAGQLQAIPVDGPQVWSEYYGERGAGSPGPLQMEGMCALTWGRLDAQLGALGLGRRMGGAFQPAELDHLKAVLGAIGPAMKRWSEAHQRPASAPSAPTQTRTGPELSATLDLAGKVLTISPQFAQRLGEKPLRVKSHPLSSRVAPEARFALAQLLAQVAGSQEPVYQNIVFSVGDRERWPTRVSAEGLRDSQGRLSRIALRIVDDSRQAGVERTLNRIKRFFTNVVPHLPCMVLSTDADGSVRVNSRVEQITGYPISAFRSDPLLWLTMVHPEDRQGLLEALSAAARAGEVGSLSLRLQHRGTGRSIPVQGYATAVFDGDSLRSLDAVLEELNPKVQSRSPGPGSDMAAAPDEDSSKQAMALGERTERLVAIGQVAANVAHELATPLSSVAMNLESIATEAASLGDLDGDNSPKEMAARCQSLLGLLHETTQGLTQARSIAEDLRGHTRSAQETLNSSSVSELIESSLRMAQHALRGRCRVDYQVETGLPSVMVNTSRIRQVLLNLLINAGQALSAGSTPETDFVQVTARRENDQVIIEVRDSGDGIPEEISSRIFDPYYTTKGQQDGTGLGLSIARHIVEDHGGSLTVSSSSIRGTCFSVCLPTNPARRSSRGAASVPKAELPAAPHSGQARPRKRILIVDDNAALLRSVTRLLRADYEVSTVSSAAAVGQTLERDPHWDVVLLDACLGDSQGLRVYEDLRSRWPELAAKVSFFTGDPEDEAVKHLSERDELKVLAKPVAPSELRRFIAEVIVAREPQGSL